MANAPAASNKFKTPGERNQELAEEVVSMGSSDRSSYLSFLPRDVLQQATCLISVIKPIAWKIEPCTNYYHVSDKDQRRGHYKATKELVYFDLRSCKKEKGSLLLAGFEVLQSLPPHPNIVGLRETFRNSTENTVLFIRPIGPTYYNLLHILKSEGPFRSDRTMLDLCKSLLRQLLTALSYMHNRNYVFGKINAEGCMARLSPSHLLLWDFSGACAVGTPGPRSVELCDTASPEQLTESYLPAATSQDMWCVGWLAFVLLSGFSPFNSASAIQSAVFRFTGSAWYNASSDCTDFIRHLLVVSPKHRYTTAQCLVHRWLAN